MKKTDAIKLFGGVVKLAEACEIEHSSVSQWPETLPRRIADRVIGAAVRNGLKVPKRLLKAPAERTKTYRSESKQRARKSPVSAENTAGPKAPTP